MRHFFSRWLINALALLVLIGFGLLAAETLWVVLVVAVVWGFLNTFLKTILVRLNLSTNLLTLGFVTLVANGFLLALTARLAPGFEVADFQGAFLAALLISIVSFLLSRMTKEKP